MSRSPNREPRTEAKLVIEPVQGSAETREAITTPVVVRAELESLLERDLLGPWDGPEEELEAGSSPAERYLLGRLVPRSPDVGVEEATEDTEFARPSSSIGR
jgi:hypothetical protein